MASRCHYNGPMNVATEEDRVYGWEAIGQVIGLKASGARSRYRTDARFRRLIRKGRGRKRWARRADLLRYEGADERSRR